MKTNDIRKIFLEFFRGKDHTIVPSDSLVPTDDPSLLFTSAGMVQFKQYYTSVGHLSMKRAASCQKCFRTPDLGNVGFTPRHHTFFEMLGNFSFGDYFKKEAIAWAWEFVINVIHLPKDELWVSVYKDDKEAYEIWHKSIGIPDKKIVKLGKEDNFWGPVNPEGGICGPCSEIYIDFGTSYGCGKSTCKPGCDCDRYEEFWNLVFPSYNQNNKGELTSLAKPGIDTGMGLERLASILQGVKNNFEIDIIKPIIETIANKAHTGYGENKKKDVSIKIIADHIRASCFLIADGVVPSNIGRGYVLRRIIRRAVRQGKLININSSFMYGLVNELADLMREPYPDLIEKKDYISKLIKSEEERFHETLEQGTKLIDELIHKYKGKSDVVSGKETFKLYDTFGFPLELTSEILAEHKLSVNENEFKECLSEQQERARKSWKGSGIKESSEIYLKLKESYGSTNFLGYTTTKSSANVIAILKDEKIVDMLNEGETGDILLNETPFYGESGGQIGDIGILDLTDGIVQVNETIKPVADLIVHKIKVFKGKLKVGDKVQGIVDKFRRTGTARHHTATHLLQAALREVLGNHVIQSGSFVSHERLRFDFTHFSELSKKEIFAVEKIVNEMIREAIPVEAKLMSINEAKKQGALAFFGEKYSELVRMISIGNFSKELCGGTHVKSTAELNMLKIAGESSIAAGVRRIEAVAGEAALKYMNTQQNTLESVSGLLKTTQDELVGSVVKFLEALSSKDKEIEGLKKNAASIQTDTLLKEIQAVEGIKFIAARADDMDNVSLRSIADRLKDNMKSGVIVLAGLKDEKVQIVSMVTKDIASYIRANELIKEIAKIVGGSGGGTEILASAGGRETSKIDEALRYVPAFLAKHAGKK